MSPFFVFSLSFVFSLRIILVSLLCILYSYVQTRPQRCKLLSFLHTFGVSLFSISVLFRAYASGFLNINVNIMNVCLVVVVFFFFFFTFFFFLFSRYLSLIFASRVSDSQECTLHVGHSLEHVGALLRVLLHSLPSHNSLICPFLRNNNERS